MCMRYTLGFTQPLTEILNISQPYRPPHLLRGELYFTLLYFILLFYILCIYNIFIYVPHFLDISTNWKLVVSFSPLLLYPWGKNPCYPLDRRQGGPQIRSGQCRIEKDSLPYRDLNSNPSVI
jgi:hypothetical protein